MKTPDRKTFTKVPGPGGGQPITGCKTCPHRSPGFLSEPSTCVHGERKNMPYDFLCAITGFPDHCPLQTTRPLP